MSRRLPIATVKYATDSFNWINRINNRIKTARVQIQEADLDKKYTSIKYNRGWWQDWKYEAKDNVPTEVNKKCYPPIVAIRRIKVWLFKVNMRVNYGLKCRKCIVEVVIPK